MVAAWRVPDLASPVVMSCRRQVRPDVGWSPGATQKLARQYVSVHSVDGLAHDTVEAVAVSNVLSFNEHVCPKKK